MVEIDKTDLRTMDDLRRAADETLEAMRKGVDVIFQATFFDGRWRGHADFLFRVETGRATSATGPTRSPTPSSPAAVKAGAILQMCAYSEQLDGLQGVAPDCITSSPATASTHRSSSDYSAYYRYVRSALRGAGARDADGPAADHLSREGRPLRRVPLVADVHQRRRDDDHLSLVAGMRRDDTERLTAGGRADPREPRRGRDAERRSPRWPLPTFERLRHQARLQVDERTTGSRVVEVHRARADDPDTRGLGILPEPSPWDVFFDMEADPWARRRRPRVPVRDRRRWTRASRDYRPIWGTTQMASAPRSSDVHRARDRAARCGPGHARLPLRRLRGWRAEAARRAARHRRGGDRSRCSAATCSSTCSTSSARACGHRSSRTR